MAIQRSWRASVRLAVVMHSGVNVVGEPGLFGTARYIMVRVESRKISSESTKNSVRSLPIMSLEYLSHCNWEKDMMGIISIRNPRVFAETKAKRKERNDLQLPLP